MNKERKPSSRKQAELKKLYDVISATEEQLTSNADQLVTFEALEAELAKIARNYCREQCNVGD